MKSKLRVLKVRQSKQQTFQYWTDERLSAPKAVKMPRRGRARADYEMGSSPSYEKADTNQPPAGDCGAFRSSGGGCSAAAVSPRLVLTAAHCVFTNGEINDNQVFLPRYWGNIFPWRYPIKLVCFYQNYLDSGGTEYDLAICITYDNMSSQIGYLEPNLSYEFSQGNPVTMFGYPGGLDSGNIMYRDNGYNSSSDATEAANESALAGLPDHGVEGVSGGPWLDSSNRLIGLSSESDFVSELYSPILMDGKFDNLFKYAEGEVE